MPRWRAISSARYSSRGIPQLLDGHHPDGLTHRLELYGSQEWDLRKQTHTDVVIGVTRKTLIREVSRLCIRVDSRGSICNYFGAFGSSRGLEVG